MFSFTASIDGACVVFGTGPNVGFGQPSCDGFSPPTSIDVSIDISGDGGLLTATPIPAAFPLFATGLGALGLFGWRRKKNATVQT